MTSLSSLSAEHQEMARRILGGEKFSRVWRAMRMGCDRAVMVCVEVETAIGQSLRRGKGRPRSGTAAAPVPPVPKVKVEIPRCRVCSLAEPHECVFPTKTRHDWTW